MDKRIEIYSLISGLVFLISGIAKAIDISVFSNAISQYGFENIQFISPVIILAEVLIGLALIFQVWPKLSALTGAVLIVGFTLVYIYGIVFCDVEDCGCFGKITVLNTSPVFTFVRNAVLLYLFIAIWRKSENKNNLNQWIAITILIFMCLTAFMSGYTFRYTGRHTKEYQPRALSNTVLNEFITTSKDSTLFGICIFLHLSALSQFHCQFERIRTVRRSK